MLRSPLLPIFLTVFVDVLALTMVLPLLPHYALDLGATPFIATTLAASFAACQLISGPILGRISDSAGRKPTLLVSQAGTFVGFMTIGFAEYAHSLPMLFLGRIIDGCTAGNLSIAQAYISDVTQPENRTKAFGLIGIAFGAGFTIGPWISGILGHRLNYAAPAFAAAGLSLMSILCTWLLLPARPAAAAATAQAGAPRRSLDIGRFFRQPLSRRRLLEFFAFSLSFSTLIGGLALFLKARFGYDVEKTGYIFGVSGLVGAMIQGGLIGRLVKRLGEERLSTIGFAAMAVGYGLLGAAFDVPFLLTLVVIGAFGGAVTRPSITTMLTKSVGPQEQGGALGASQSLGSIAQIVGPLTAGWLIEHERLGAYGIAAGGFALAGVVLRLCSEPEGGAANPLPKEAPSA
jgi:MFS transporter, DHA1 family, tetracycline resistance protein